MRMRQHTRIRLVTALCALVAAAAGADEGMWLFNDPPRERLARDHAGALAEATLSPEWLLHLQQASVRFNSGGSGAFVSADGLVITNHHVGADSLQKLGDARHDYYRDGFLAASRDEELRCHDLELNVLVSIEDVTARVQKAVGPGMNAPEAFAARRRVMAEIEQESLAATGLRSDVVTLHQGGLYHLYRARKYTDVRLVFAPERQIAFFGGDADNFEFPRHDLDICFFRAYEDGKPARVPHHLAWGQAPVAEGELVFVSGHPGHTDRAKTVRELVALRDRQIPFSLAVMNRLEVLLGAYSDEGPEEARQAAEDLFGVQNARKARYGLLGGLLDPVLMRHKQEAEERLRDLLDRQGPRPGASGSPFDRIDQAEDDIARVALRHDLLEAAIGFNSRFFAHARTILRAAAEGAKPSGERLREYRDSNRASLELALFSDEPLYERCETVKLADSLMFLATALGPGDPLVQQVLAGKSPRDRAAELVRGSGLGRRAEGERADAPADVRRRLYDGGAAAVAASTDPMLALARTVDEESRSLRQTVEAAGEVKRQAHAEIAQARFAQAGKELYPDATFTLRLAYGTVRGYEEQGRLVPAKTTYADLFERARQKRDTPPYDLPERWRKLRQELERDAAFLATPLNFVSTADIIGGNSGSPVVDTAGRLVGVIFDGNIHSLVLDVAYEDVQARAISVDAAGILAALRRVYGAEGLVAELVGRGDAAGAAGKDAWNSLFDGRTLGRWRATAFGGEGEVAVEDGAIRIERGADLSGITWTGDVPRQDYEIALSAQRAEGYDFFCGLTFPVGDDPCSLIVGGWGGGVVGLSSIDGQDAAHNATTSFREFASHRWYAIRVRVTPDRIECFIDDERVVDQELAGRKVSVRDEVQPSCPLGIATYATTALVKDIRWRRLPVTADGGAPAGARP